jgi:hypothetical protein
MIFELIRVNEGCEGGSTKHVGCEVILEMIEI